MNRERERAEKTFFTHTYSRAHTHTMRTYPPRRSRCRLIRVACGFPYSLALDKSVSPTQCVQLCCAVLCACLCACCTMNLQIRTSTRVHMSACIFIVHRGDCKHAACSLQYLDRNVFCTIAPSLTLSVSLSLFLFHSVAFVFTPFHTCSLAPLAISIGL